MKTKKLVQVHKSIFFFGFKYLCIICTYRDMISYLEVLLFSIPISDSARAVLAPAHETSLERELIRSIISSTHTYIQSYVMAVQLLLFTWQSVVGASAQDTTRSLIKFYPPVRVYPEKKKKKVIYHAA